MQAAETLTVLFRHHLWANLLLLERCALLSDEQLDAGISGAFGTIRDTLEHIVTSEQSYVSRITTGQPLRRVPDAPAPSFDEMRAWLRATGAALIEWAPRVRADETVVVDWDGVPREVPKTLILTQVINHATEHRAQIMAIMTQLGVEPPSVDGWSYFDASEG
jgi:uncharacterized damage-inducible protein DinB